MQSDFLAAAEHYARLAEQAIDADAITEGLALHGMAFTAAFMPRSLLPLSFQLCHPATLPVPVASSAHVVAHLNSQGIVLFAQNMIATHPLRFYRRFPMMGHILSRTALRLPPGHTFQCIIDLGDGDDEGDYRRVAYSSRRVDAVLIPDPYFDIYENYDAVRRVAAQAQPWRERKDMVVWRGTAGGQWLYQPDLLAQPIRWDWLQRLHLCAAARGSRFAPRLNIAMSSLRQITDPQLVDAIMAADLLWPEIPKADFLHYRYQVDIDGWANSWSLLDKLIMGSVIFKVQSAFGYRQWYYDQLVPWQNFIPVAADLSDFDTSLEWAFSHPDQCAAISANALALADRIQLAPALVDAEAKILACLEPVSL